MLAVNNFAAAYFNGEGIKMPAGGKSNLGLKELYIYLSRLH